MRPGCWGMTPWLWDRRLCKGRYFYGLNENAGRENDGPSTLQGMKLQDMKLQDRKLQDMKMPDMKMQDMNTIRTKNDGMGVKLRLTVENSTVLTEITLKITLQ